MGLKLNLTHINKENMWVLKPIAICFVIILIAVGITAFFVVGDQMEQIKQTPEYQMALDYLQSQPDIIENYGSDVPSLVSHHYEYENGNPSIYTYTFIYNWIPVINLGDKYIVELNYIDGQWVVIGIVD